jgi:hypothetical protein
MKNLLITLLTFAAFASPAFAIDQVILKNGDIVEGKVLSDVPNRHVDIQLINGNKKRFQQTEVSSIERDVPSNKAIDTFGSESKAFFGLNLGGFTNQDAGDKGIKFNYGARFGVNVGQLGDFSKFSFGLGFNRSTTNNYGISSGISELMVQMLFRKVANGGFYFGPQIGLAFLSADVGGVSIYSKTQLNYGVLAGYDYYFSPSFSMGPELNFTYSDNNTIFKFLLGVTMHF